MIMANNDEGREGHGLPFSTMVIAILVPSVMVVVVVGLIVLHRRRVRVFPCFPCEDDVLVRQERRQTRQSELENSIQAQHFCDWLAGQKEKHPGSVPAVDPLWYVLFLCRRGLLCIVGVRFPVGRFGVWLREGEIH
ncbi:hypothetical protein IAQ61_001106 [Plenodomus lingam]|uniref:uncharacterized protein n=1 Tax=Leptosphaeria maculans TaxID=5022 RepID=UPI0033295F63|nr:hypothetical protein IAQ61_001106 [Plenodomus lingam]